MRPEEIYKEYEHHFAAADSEFRRGFQRYADHMQCHRGCSMCCSQVFSISLIEAAYISRKVKALPDDERERLRDAARDYVARFRKLYGNDETGDREETITPRPGMRLQCPALKDDACSIYDARPLICRKWGIPLFNPGKPMELQACELNFRPGEEVDVEGMIEPQVALLEQWVELKGRALGDVKQNNVTATVAEAILHDYEEILLSRAGK